MEKLELVKIKYNKKSTTYHFKNLKGLKIKKRIKHI